MSLYDYKLSKDLAESDAEYTFVSLIMAALRKADSLNATRIKAVWPEIANEMQKRYDAPGGRLPED